MTSSITAHNLLQLYFHRKRLTFFIHPACIHNLALTEANKYCQTHKEGIVLFTNVFYRTTVHHLFTCSRHMTACMPNRFKTRTTYNIITIIVRTNVRVWGFFLCIHIQLTIKELSNVHVYITPQVPNKSVFRSRVVVIIIIIMDFIKTIG